MELIKQQLLVCAPLANDVTVTSYDTSTWSSLNQWKSSLVSRNTLLFLPSWRSLMGANETKPMIHVWSSESFGSRQPESKIVMPGHFSCLVASYDENYCVASFENSLYVWLISTGDLVALVHNVHFQSITKVIFFPDNERIATASKDSRIKVFSLLKLINEKTITGDCEALHVLSGHTMPITDLYCSRGDSSKNWLFSASLDKTVKVWEANFGQLLSTFVLETSPTCIITDVILSSIFIGCLDGKVKPITLKPKETYKPMNMLTSSDLHNFSGHSSEITCMDISIDSSVLFSGSIDKTVKVWLIKNYQCLRTLTFEGPVTNLKVSLHHACEKFVYPREIFPRFSRTLFDQSKAETRVLPVRNLDIISTENLKPIFHSSQASAELGNNLNRLNMEECFENEYEAKRLKSEIDDKFRTMFEKLANSL